MNSINPDDEDYSPFDDPENILYVDPNAEEEELSLADTQEMELPEQIKKQLIVLNKNRQKELAAAFRQYHITISTFPKKDDDEILRAHYCIVIINKLLKSQSGLASRDEIQNMLKNETYIPTNSRYDEGVFDAAFHIIHNMNN